MFTFFTAELLISRKETPCDLINMVALWLRKENNMPQSQQLLLIAGLMGHPQTNLNHIIHYMNNYENKNVHKLATIAYNKKSMIKEMV